VLLAAFGVIDPSSGSDGEAVGNRSLNSRLGLVVGGSVLADNVICEYLQCATTALFRLFVCEETTLAADNAKEEPKSSGGESAINSAPPVPGQQGACPGHEQPIQPAPAIPTGGTQQAGMSPQERALGPAPTIPVSGSPEQKIAGPGAIPASHPSTGPTAERPLASAPQLPISGTQETQLAGPAPIAGQPPTAGQMPMAGPAPMAGQTPMASSVPSAIPQQPGVVGGETPLANAPTAGVPVAGQGALQPGQPAYAQPTLGAGPGYPAAPTGGQVEMPMTNPAMVQGAGYPTPMAPAGPAGMPNPGWGQPPSNPPPVPPPNEPLAPHQQAGPVGSVAGQPQPSAAGTLAVSGKTANRSSRTSTARTLRRRSQERSSYFAIMFLFGAALFLVFVVIVLVVSLL
jgi:hypothetical protein